jgi:hypothetical protein
VRVFAMARQRTAGAVLVLLALGFGCGVVHVQGFRPRPAGAPWRASGRQAAKAKGEDDKLTIPERKEVRGPAVCALERMPPRAYPRQTRDAACT